MKGEFNFVREFPPEFMKLNQAVVSIEGTNETITYEQLLNWYSKEYSKDKYGNQVSDEAEKAVRDSEIHS